MESVAAHSAWGSRFIVVVYGRSRMVQSAFVTSVHSRRTSIFSAIAVFLLLVSGWQSHANGQTFGIQNGPRAYWTAPIGTRAIDMKFESLEAGIDFNGVVLNGVDLKVMNQDLGIERRRAKVGLQFLGLFRWWLPTGNSDLPSLQFVHKAG